MWIDRLFSLFNGKSKWISIALPMILLGVLFFSVTLNNVYSRTYDLEQFNRAKETIRSPITIENEVETDRKTRESVQAVGDRYTTFEEITKDQVSYLEELFDAIDLFTTSKDKDKDLTNEEIVLQLQDILSDDITEKIDGLVYMRLLRLEPKERSKGRDLFIKSAETILVNGVRTENIQGAKEEIRATIRYSSLHNDVKDALGKLIDFAIVENAFFDVEKTMEARNTAASNVEPVVIKSGDIIVRKGQIITKEMYDDLRLVGLLLNERSVFPAVGLAFFVLFIVGLIGYELQRLYHRGQLDNKKVFAFLMISVFVVTAMKIVSMYTNELNHLFLLVPIATGALLLKLLLFERFSLMMAVIYAVLASVLFNGQIPGSLNMEASIYFLFFQFIGIILLHNVEDRLQLIRATIGMALINVMTILMFIFLSIEKFVLGELVTQVAFGVGAAIFSAILTIGLLPFFETGLGILTDNKLLTLANPNQPLLRKILVESPGTYHHSVMVANLSEAACEAVGANGLLARVGSYYHDIGKTIKPHYFIENQVAIKNPHDFIEPEKSATIIIHHVIDGVNMLKQHRLPQEIIDIAAQHHGTSLVAYFYRQAKEENPDIDESIFRYPGPKPLTREAGIISICDSVEAAVRSLKQPSAEKIDEIVLAIMNQKLLDGQFDETPLTLKELSLVRETVCKALKGIFHSRIQYPEKEAN